MNKSFTSLFAVLALLLTAGANAGTISFAGLDVDPAFGITVIEFNNTDTSAISSLTFDFTYVPTPPSWSEELVIQITHMPSGNSLRAGALAPTSPEPGFVDHCEFVFGGICDIDLGAPAISSGFLTVSGLTVAFPVADGSGLWRIEIGDGFDDTGVVDGLFEDGSRLELNTVAPIPVPAAAWLFASAMLGLAGLRRRRA